MADETLLLKSEGNVDVQIGGPGNAWNYLSSCASMSGPSVPRGGTEIRWCQDAQRSGEHRISSQFKTAPDQISADLMTKLSKVDFLSDLGCPFTIRARFSRCNEREDPSNYDPLMLSYCNAQLQEHSYEDLVITDPGDNDEILVTAPWQALYELRIKKLVPDRIGTATNLGDQPINDIEFCDSESCGGYCGEKSDGCTTFYGVTDADTTPYANPNIIKAVKNLVTSVITYTLAPILGINGNVENIECAGSRIIVSSNADSVVAYNDNDTDQDEWNIISIANAPTANPNALYARTAREIWLAANSGFIYKSVDGGQTWGAVHEADITSENINAIYAFNSDLVYAVGDNGIILKSSNGGETWSDKTEVATTSANLISVKVPPSRPKEVFIGTNDGQIFRSKDEGETFAAVSFPGDGVGSVDDIDFCGPCAGDIMYILHNDGGPRGRILRDFSGGNGGADVEIVSDYTKVVASGIDLNSMACCGENEVIAAGENFSSFPVIIKAN